MLCPGYHGQPTQGQDSPHHQPSPAQGKGDWILTTSRGAGKAERESIAGLSNPSFSTTLKNDWLDLPPHVLPSTCSFGSWGSKAQEAGILGP